MDKGKYDFFHYDQCDLCGDCLARCQYMDLTQSEAVEEMKHLIAGEPTRVVHDKCISCYACNVFCPHDCHPYELIISTWNERYREKGLPVRASYLMPASSPNFRTDILKHLGAGERALLRKWKETPPEGEYVIYPGCNALTLPHLLDAGFLRDVPVSGDFDLCCGEMYFRMGLFEVVERTAEKLTEYYRGRDIGTMLFVCPAGLNMFRNVLPHHFGAEFPFKAMYLGEYLLGKVESGEIEISARLDRQVAVHDSCHARILGDEVMETSRRLYSLMGLGMREMDHNREEGFCCGMAAGCNSYRPDDMYFAAVKELREAHRTGANELAVYCGGCQLTLAMIRWLYPFAPPVFHLLEYLAEATGETPYLPASRRSLRMLGNVAYKAFPKLFSRETYRIDV
jgi:Fe-S oxidoreductase